jgi:4-aminobutyrate aminotransferase-like enzyme
LREFASFVPFPKEATRKQPGDPDLAHLESIIQQKFNNEKIGAILVEPIQVRGGVNIPPRGFLPLLRRLCDANGALLILDEIYTGFGRTGAWFACEHSEVVPDLICLGKALTGGFPLSACVGRADLMDKAWPPSQGEAIHTSTFLGHPVGCAMALAQIDEIKTHKLVAASAKLGQHLLNRLNADFAEHFAQIRGQGLLVGVELNLANGSPATHKALAAIKMMLHQGFILLPEGEHANVISFTPPLTITQSQLTAAAKALADTLRAARTTARPRKAMR